MPGTLFPGYDQKINTMKNYQKIVVLWAALVFLPGASIWEGAAAVSADFPESGMYVATDSFPRNTVVDLTNLETGKTVRVVVTSGLDTPGLLATVSREAAEAVGLQSRAIGRIRLTVSSDPAAFPRPSGDYRSGDPDYDPLAAVEGVYGKEPPPEIKDEPPPMLVIPPSEPPPGNPIRRDPESVWAIIPKEYLEPPPPKEPLPPEIVIVPAPPPPPEIVYVPGPPPPPEVVYVPAPPPPPEVVYVPAPPPPPEVVYVPAPPPPPEVVYVPEYNYTLTPAEERPPPYQPNSGGYSTPPVVVVPPPPPPVFSVPAVSSLERGRYYLQLGAYSQIGTVEQELYKIERSYPLTVQCIGGSSMPVYRILIGPVSQGEAAALLRKFQTRGYKDAFVRRGD